LYLYWVSAAINGRDHLATSLITPDYWNQVFKQFLIILQVVLMLWAGYNLMRSQALARATMAVFALACVARATLPILGTPRPAPHAVGADPERPRHRPRDRGARDVYVHQRPDARALHGRAGARRDGGPGAHLSGADRDVRGAPPRRVGTRQQQVRARHSPGRADPASPRCPQPCSRGAHLDWRARRGPLLARARVLWIRGLAGAPPGPRLACPGAARLGDAREHERQLDRV